MAEKRRRKSEGSVRERRKGLWQGRITLEGKTYSVSGRTEREVLRALRAITDAHEQGLEAIDGRVRVREFITEWLNGAARAKVRSTTWATYEMYVRRYIIPGLGEKRLARLTPDDIDRFLSSTTDRKGRPLASNTVKQIRAILRSAFSDAERRHMVARNVVKLSTPPRAARRELQVLTVDHARKLIAKTADDRFGALYVLALDTGMRQGELLGLRWRDVDLEKHSLTTVQTLAWIGGAPTFNEPKTKTSRRTIELSKKSVEVLKAWRKRQAAEELAARRWRNQHGLVFTTETGGPLHSSTVTKRLQRILAREKLPPIRFHDLRHSSASFLLSQGLPAKVVAERLGHSSINVTLDVYGHLAQELKAEAAERMDGILGS